jgi:hypothetical protein
VFAQRHNTFPADASCLIRCIVHGKACIVLGMYVVGLVLLIPQKRRHRENNADLVRLRLRTGRQLAV